MSYLGRGRAGYHNLFSVARLAGDLTAPLEFAVAVGRDIDQLLLHVEAALFAHPRTLPDLLGLIGAVDLTSLDDNPLETQPGVHPAVVERWLQKHQVPLVQLCLLC